MLINVLLMYIIYNDMLIIDNIDITIVKWIKS
jgi:hypothetical protein